MLHGSGVAKREFSVLHEMAEAVSVDAGLSGGAPSKRRGRRGAHCNQVQ